MKKVTVLVATLIAVLLCMAACNSSGEIVSINNHDAIYRFKVKEVQLIETDSKNVLTFNTDFKYYYGSSDTLFYGYDGIYGNSELQYYFPDLHIVSSSTGLTTEYGNFCKEYETNVYVRAILEKCDKVYRPTYKADGVIATITYAKAESLTDRYKIFKEEINYSKFKKLYQEVSQKYFELYEIEDDQKAAEAYLEEVEKEWLGYVCIYETTEVVNLCQRNLTIEYFEYDL